MLAGKKALIVDDDIEFRQSLAGVLANLGLFVVSTPSGEQFVDLLEKEEPDIVLIDKDLGGSDGFDLIYRVRKRVHNSNIPVLVVSGSACEEDKYEAIKMGADDLLAKPLKVEDLKFRMIAVFRRAQSYRKDESLLTVGPFEIDTRRYTIRVADKPLFLTKTEYKVFLELALRKGELVSREWVSSNLLSLKNQNPRTIDVHMTSIRKKLGQYGKCIKTIRGRGYLFHLD